MKQKWYFISHLSQIDSQSLRMCSAVKGAGRQSLIYTTAESAKQSNPCVCGGNLERHTYILSLNSKFHF